MNTYNNMKENMIYLCELSLFAMDHDQKNLYVKYISLLQFIINRRECSFEDIQNSVTISNAYGGKIPERTFQRHRDKIQQNFGITIHCRRKMYSISDEDIQKVEANQFYEWLKQSFALSDLISQNMSMNNRIVLDNTPAGQNHLPVFVEAMKNNLKIKITYHPFDLNPYDITICPYILKIFKQRWFVLGKSKDIRVYSLGRIDKCELTEETFNLPNNFDPEDFFLSTYGVTIYDKEQIATIIKIKVENQKNYLRELPLHESQVEHDMGSYSIFEYFLKPSLEFTMEMLSYGEKVEILEPKDFRDKVKAIISKMNKIYF